MNTRSSALLVYFGLLFFVITTVTPNVYVLATFEGEAFDSSKPWSFRSVFEMSLRAEELPKFQKMEQGLVMLPMLATDPVTDQCMKSYRSLVNKVTKFTTSNTYSDLVYAFCEMPSECIDEAAVIAGNVLEKFSTNINSPDDDDEELLQVTFLEQEVNFRDLLEGFPTYADVFCSGHVEIMK